MTFKSKVLGKWDPKDYARKVGGTWEATPAEFYPAMIGHIMDSQASGELPAELIDKRVNPEVDPCLAARRYRNWARRIPGEAWADATLPLAQVLSTCDVRRIKARAEALECARLWFTRALKNNEKSPIYIHILKDTRFALGVSEEFRA